MLQEELEQFNPTLLKRPALVALTKLDLLTDPADLDALTAQHNPSPIPISSATGEGLPELIKKISKMLYEIEQGDSD